MTRLSEVIATELQAAMSNGDFKVADVVDRVREAAPEVVADEADRLVNNALARRIKDLLRDFDDDDEVADQGALFGLPRAIAFEAADGISYIDTEKAQWGHLKGALSIRASNVSRAERRLRALELVMARVEPVMATDPFIKLGQAIALVDDAAA